MTPLRLKPNYISPIWSGGRIAQARGIVYDKSTPPGESFDVTAHRDLVNTVEGGPYDGIRLDELIDTHHEELLGRGLPDDDGVIQVVTMDARASLSVQVHPDEAYAQAHENDHEKTESWYILAADPGATLIAGSTTDDRGALRAAAADDTVGDRFGRRVSVSEGDFILIPAGTMHALGAGIFAVEIGSLGFKTYRICDWGRGRELHVKQGFDLIDTSLRPEPRHLGAFDPNGPDQVQLGVTHELFEAEVVDVHGEFAGRLLDRYQILTCVWGDAQVITPEGGTTDLKFTESLLIPASAGGYTVRGTCRVIRSYRP